MGSTRASCTCERRGGAAAAARPAPAPGNARMLNRPQVFDTIQQHMHACAREQSTLGLLLVRLQRVHELNMLFGYALREQLEAAALQQLIGALRPVDVVVPIGTGEFLVLLPGLLGPN